MRERHGAVDDRYGMSVATIGEVTGDDVPDFAVGNYNSDTGGRDGGRVVVYSGADRSVWCFTSGGASYDHLGGTAAAVGDMNADGVPDFATSAPDHHAVIVFSGADCTEIARCADTGTSSTNLGGDHGLAGWVDVTGDGVPEIIAGGDSSNAIMHYGGSAMVFTLAGPGGSCSILHSLVDPQLSIYGYLGYAVSGLGDLTGDGTPDIAVGEPGDDTRATDAGAILIFSGATGALATRWTDPAGASGDRLGESLAPIGDLDGDGTADLLAGAARRNTSAGSDAGQVVVFSTASGSVIRRVDDPGGAAGDWLGWSLAAVHDMDGDGVEEILAGVRNANPGGLNNAGRVVLFSGASGLKLRSFENPAGAAGDQLGYSVADAGDLSGDGVSEILVGIPYQDLEPGLDVGSAMLFAVETDCDSDGLAPFGGDCDDTNSTLWSVPGEVGALRIASDRVTLSWSAPTDPGQSSGLLLYDTLRAPTPAGFRTGTCIESDGGDLQSVDPASPPAGTVYCYLARAQNPCGDGHLGEDSEGGARHGRACP